MNEYLQIKYKLRSCIYLIAIFGFKRNSQLYFVIK